MRTIVLAAFAAAALVPAAMYAQPVDGAAALLLRFDTVQFPIATPASSPTNEEVIDGERALLGHSVQSRTDGRWPHAAVIVAAGPDFTDLSMKNRRRGTAHVDNVAVPRLREVGRDAEVPPLPVGFDPRQVVPFGGLNSGAPGRESSPDRAMRTDVTHVAEPQRHGSLGEVRS